MNAMPESVVINSCQYTPVYLIQDPGASQGQSYFIAQSSLEESKPVSDNLKSFYENSGNIENGFVNVNSSVKPRILKKQDSVVGNNLKLANFLIPKNENAPKQHYVVNNVILKPNASLKNSTHTSLNSTIQTNSVSVNNTNNSVSSVTNTISGTTTISSIPRLNMNSKIVKLKDTSRNGTPLKSRYTRIEKARPKNKPKDLPPILQDAPSKHTSLQLLKLGETYHSLNELSDEQMKMVSQALKMFSNPQKVAYEPAYDPVTNTNFIYKLVSPRDLTVVGKNKDVNELKETENTAEEIIKPDLKREHVNKIEPRKETISKEFPKKDNTVKEILKKESVVKDVVKKDNVQKHELKRDVKKNEQKLMKQRILRELMEQKEMADAIETRQPKVTRSGRKVKFPKLSFHEGVTSKPKRKNTTVPCFQCSADFPSLYRLQKHYQTHPTHIPTKIHSNLFHCLLAIVKGGSEDDQTNIFVQQLDQLIVKLRSVLPCLLSTSEKEGKSCTLSEDVGRLLGLNAGNYNLNVEALICDKNKNGYCQHNPPPTEYHLQENGDHCGSTNIEDIANAEAETEDCARINSVENWPSVNKRVWKQKQQRSQENAKRMRLASENTDTFIELGIDNTIILRNSLDCPEETSAIINEQGAEDKAEEIVIKIECNNLAEKELNVNIVEEISEKICTVDKHQDTILKADNQGQKNHAQFYSAHFDIRSSPIKPSSTTFRKFQINPDLLAKYESQIIRSIETVDKDQDGNSKIPCPTVQEVLETRENVLETSAEVLKSNENNIHLSSDILQTCRGVLHINENGLQSSQDILETDNDVLASQQVTSTNGEPTDVLSNDDALQEIFRDDDLAAVKESFILDRELKDWILNRSNEDKSEDGFIKSTSLIEPALLHVKDHEIKSHLGISEKDDLTRSDTHDESSVLNFLDTLATDCLAYPGTEIRTNNGEFQMDLFSFHSS